MTIKRVNLSDKEADYIIALASGVDKEKIVKSLSITEAEIEQLYKKFGLKNKNMVRDVQLVTLTCMGNFISEYFEINANKDFKFEECQELAQTVNEMQKNDKKFKEEIMKVVEEELESRFKK